LADFWAGYFVVPVFFESLTLTMSSGSHVVVEFEYCIESFVAIGVWTLKQQFAHSHSSSSSTISSTRNPEGALPSISSMTSKSPAPRWSSLPIMDVTESMMLLR